MERRSYLTRQRLGQSRWVRHVLTMVRWATIDALVKSGCVAHAERPGAYCITGVGRVALAGDAKDSETV